MDHSPRSLEWIIREWHNVHNGPYLQRLSLREDTLITAGSVHNFMDKATPAIDNIGVRMLALESELCIIKLNQQRQLEVCNYKSLLLLHAVTTCSKCIIHLCSKCMQLLYVVNAVLFTLGFKQDFTIGFYQWYEYFADN